MASKSQIDGPIRNTPDANDDNCIEHPRRMEIGIEKNFGAKDNEILTPENVVVKKLFICLGPPINLKNLSTYRKKALLADNDYFEQKNPKRMRNNTSDNDVILSASSYTTLSCMTTQSQFIGPFDHEFLVKTNKNEKVGKKIKTQLVDKNSLVKRKKMTFNRFFYYSNKLLTKSQRKLLCKSIDLNFNLGWKQFSKLQYNSQNVSIALIRKIKMLKKMYEHTKFKKLFDGMKISLKKLLKNDRSLFINSSRKLHILRCYQKLSKYYLRIMKLCFNTFKSKLLLLEYDNPKKSKNNVSGKCKKQYPNNMKKKNENMRKKRTIGYFINNIISPVFVASTYYYDINYFQNLSKKMKQTWRRRPVTRNTNAIENKLLADIKFETDDIPTNINDDIVKKIKTNDKIAYDDVTASLHTYEKKLRIVFTNQQMTRMADNFYGFYNYNKRLGSNTVIDNGINEDSDADDNDPLDYFELVDSDVDMSEDFSDSPLISANQTVTTTYVDYIGLNSTRSSVIRRKNDAENKLIYENKTKLVEKCYDYFFNVNFLKMMSRPNDKSSCVDNVFEMVYNGRDLNNAHSVSGKIETITKSLSSFSPILRFNKTNYMKNTVGSDNSINNFDMNYYMSQRNMLDTINLTNTSIINDNTVITETDSKKKYTGKVIKNSAGIDNVIHDEKTSTSTETTNLIDVETSNSSSSLNSTHCSKSEKDTAVLNQCCVTLVDKNYCFNKKKDEIVTDEVHSKLSDEVNDTPLNDNITLVENDQENNSDIVVENKDTFDDIINHGSISTLTDVIKIIDIENIISKEKHAENVEEKETDLNNSIYEVVNDIIMYDKVNDITEVEYLDNNKLEMEMDKSFPPKSCSVERCDGKIRDCSNNISDVINEVTDENVNDSMVNDYFDSKNLEIEVDTLPDGPYDTLLSDKIVLENEFIENTSAKVDDNAANFEDIMNHENISITMKQMEIVDIENLNCVNAINSIIPDVSTYSTNCNVLSTPFMQSELDNNIIALDICKDVKIINGKESENVGDIEMVSKICLDQVISNVVTTDQCFEGVEQFEIEIHEALPLKSNTFAEVGGLSILNDENVVICDLNDINSDFNTSISDIPLDKDGIFAEDYNVESEEEEEVITVNLNDIDRSSPVNGLHVYMETIDLTNDDDNKTDLHYLHNTTHKDIYKVVLSQVQNNDTYERFVSMYKNDINMLAYKLKQAGIGIPITKEDIIASRMTVTFITTYKKWFEIERQDADVARNKLVIDMLKDIFNCMKKKDMGMIGRVDEYKMTIAINVTFKILNADQCFTKKRTNPTHSSSFFFSDVMHNDMSANSGWEVASQNEMVNLLNEEKFDVTFKDVNGGGSPPTNVCTIMIKEILNINFQNKIQVQIKTGDDTRDEMTCKHMMSYTVDEANDKLSTTDNQFIVNELSITDDQFIVNEMSTTDDQSIVNELSITDDQFIVNELLTNDDAHADCFDDFPTSFDDFPMGFDNAGSLLFL